MSSEINKGWRVFTCPSLLFFCFDFFFSLVFLVCLDLYLFVIFLIILRCLDRAYVGANCIPTRERCPGPSCLTRTYGKDNLQRFHVGVSRSATYYIALGRETGFLQQTDSLSCSFAITRGEFRGRQRCFAVLIHCQECDRFCILSCRSLINNMLLFVYLLALLLSSAICNDCKK